MLPGGSGTYDPAVDFQEVIRRQRMIRPPYADRPVPTEVVDLLLANTQKAPSAGFSQGFAFMVLDTDADTRLFWDLTRPRTSPEDRPRTPVIVVPLENAAAYLARYSEPDKAAFGLGERPEAWPVPYWTVDTAFATMTLLLSATAHGLGAWFFGIFTGERELLDTLGVPTDYRAIGAVALGYPSPEEKRSPSLARGRKPFGDVVRRSRW